MRPLPATSTSKQLMPAPWALFDVTIYRVILALYDTTVMTRDFCEAGVQFKPFRFFAVLKPIESFAISLNKSVALGINDIRRIVLIHLDSVINNKVLPEISYKTSFSGP